MNTTKEPYVPNKNRILFKTLLKAVKAEAHDLGHALSLWETDTNGSRVAWCVKCDALVSVDIECEPEVNGRAVVERCAA